MSSRCDSLVFVFRVYGINDSIVFLTAVRICIRIDKEYHHILN